MDKELTAIERIKKIKADYTKSIEGETEALKAELLKHLQGAKETYRLLKELGESDILGKPLFSHLVATLDLKLGLKKPAKAKGKTKGKTTKAKGKRNAVTISSAVTQALADGTTKDISTIKAAVDKLRGEDVPLQNIRQELSKQFTAKKVTRPSTGQYRKA